MQQLCQSSKYQNATKASNTDHGGYLSCESRERREGRGGGGGQGGYLLHRSLMALAGAESRSRCSLEQSPGVKTGPKCVGALSADGTGLDGTRGEALCRSVSAL